MKHGQACSLGAWASPQHLQGESVPQSSRWKGGPLQSHLLPSDGGAPRLQAHDPTQSLSSAAAQETNTVMLHSSDDAEGPLAAGAVLSGRRRRLRETEKAGGDGSSRRGARAAILTILADS